MSITNIAAKLIANQQQADTLAADLFAALQAEAAATSQAAVAAKLGLSRPYMSDVLRGNRPVGVSLARRVIEAFGKDGK